LSEGKQKQMTTIDLTEDPVNDSQVRSWYKKLMLQVNEIDSVLDATADTSGKRKFTNDLVEAQTHEWKPAVDNLSGQMNQMTEEARAGVFYGMIRAFSTAFKDQIDKWIDQQVASIPKEEVETISDEQKKALQEQRSELSKQVNAIIDMAYTFGDAKGDQENEPDPNWPKPRVRRGAFGKRGPRALSFYTWAIDGIGMEGDDDSNKGVAKKLGFEKVSEFTKALKDAGINTTEPADEFTVKIKDHEINAKRDSDDEEEEISTEPSESDTEDSE
jgi:hypothetical protein